MTLDPAESALVIYSAAEERYCVGLLQAFRAEHPQIAVEFRFGISVALHDRYLSALAAGRPDADILWSSAMDLQMGLVRNGHAAVYRSPAAVGLPDGSVYRDCAYATTLEPLVTLVDTRVLNAAQPLGSLSEIAAVLERNGDGPTGRLACFDIERNGLGFLALSHESMQLTGFDRFMDALARAGCNKCESNPALVTELASGRCAIGMHVLESYAVRAVRAHPELAIAVSATPALAVSRVALLPRSAPHPVAARRFLDFLVSHRGQAELARAGFRPLRVDSQTAVSDAELRPIRIDRGMPELLDRQRRQAFLERWRQCAG